jgi:hypothetical protein
MINTDSTNENQEKKFFSTGDKIPKFKVINFYIV